MTKTLCVADCETNAFDQGVAVIPFVWGFYDGSGYWYFWDDYKTGRTCTELFLEFLAQRDDECVIFAHNGGKFDWLFMVERFRGNLRVIGSRVVKARIGTHEFRDSFANLPVPLRDFGNKLDFDYSILHPAKRDKPANRVTILEYLKQDCIGLHIALERYRAMFGDTLTMASAAMQKLNQTCTGTEHGKIYERLSPDQDREIRPYYFGGRVQCFRTGVLEGKWNVYDVISMYPAVMRNHAHPISNTFSRRVRQHAKITDTTDFAIIDATARIGCLPLRSKTKLNFPAGRHIFHATGPEIRQALELGYLDIHEIYETITATERVCFKTFVDRFFALRQQAKTDNDVMLTLFYKLVLNSAYGKMSIDPERFTDMIALPEGEYPNGDIYYGDEIQSLVQCVEGETDDCRCPTCFRKRNAWRHACLMPGLTIWTKPVAHSDKSYANVAAGASITGYARAKLMHGIANAQNPIYCDTDSIICESLENVEMGKELGQWQHETSCSTAAIAGKKLYSLFDDGQNITPIESAARMKKHGCTTVVKTASKGVRLSASDIRAVANGETVRYTQDAPMFKLDGSQRKLSRNIRMHNS